MEMELVYSALTDVGRVRTNNEDAVRVDVGQGIDDGLLVSQPSRERTTGVKVMFASRVERDFAVFLLDFVPQRARIHG